MHENEQIIVGIMDSVKISMNNKFREADNISAVFSALKLSKKQFPDYPLESCNVLLGN